MKIKLLEDRTGVGGAGDVVEVSDARGARWVKDGIASIEPRNMPSETGPATKKDKKTKGGG